MATEHYLVSVDEDTGTTLRVQRIGPSAGIADMGPRPSVGAAPTTWP